MIKFKNTTVKMFVRLGQELYPDTFYEVDKIYRNMWLEDDAILADLASGDLILETTVVTPRQIRLGMLTTLSITENDVLVAIDSLDEPDKSVALIGWNFSVEFDRDDPLVDGVGALLGLTSAQLDTLWNDSAIL